MKPVSAILLVVLPVAPSAAPALTQFLQTNVGAHPGDIGGASGSDDVSVDVRDEGPGLSPEALQNAIAKQLAQAHGGSICVANDTPLPGATFTVTLPRAYV